MIKTATISAILLLAALPAFAQDVPDHYSQASAAARVSFPGGTIAQSTDWKDVLGVGVGADVSYGYLWHAGPQCYLGVFGSVGFDSFSGKRSSIIGGTIEPDGLDIIYIEAGPRFRLNFDNVFLDANLGFGGAFYQSADATVTAGAFSAKANAVESSSEFTFDAGGRIGVQVAKTAEIFFGVKWQMNGAPKVGSGLTGVSFERMENVVLDFGLQLNF